MWTNYHTHSTFCDGKTSLEDVVRRASEINLHALGFSSHAPLPFETTWAMRPERLPEYLATLARLSGQCEGLTIHRGLEIDYLPGQQGPATFATLLDYTIGSVHFTDRNSDGYLEIDGPHAAFVHQLSTVYQNDFRAAVTRYVELTAQMLRDDCPDILGHMDKIKIQNIENKYFNEEEAWYRQAMTGLVDVIRQSGVIVEVNTRGVYQRRTSTTYPSPWILAELASRRVPITLNSDAHHPDDLINYFPQAAAMLHELGFRQIHILRNGKWQPVNFNADGIAA